jgi:hypothetical protein
MFMTAFSSVSVRQVNAGSVGSGWIADSLVYNSSTANEVSPSIAADSIGNLYVAYRHWFSEYSHWGILVSQSSDGGKTWSYATGVSSMSTDYLNPVLAVATHGNNQVMLACELSVGGIILLKYIGGQTSIQTLVASSSAHDPSLTFDTVPPIYAYVAYESDWSGIAGDSDIYFMRSTDYSNNWTSWELPYPIVGHSDNLTYSMPSVTYGNDGNLYVAYERKSPDAQHQFVRDVYMMQNTLYGSNLTWSADPGLLISLFTSTNKHRPCIAASHTTPGTVIATWGEEYNPTDYDIEYAYSTDAGNTWNAGVLAETNADDRNPSIAVDDAGFFHVTYWEKVNAGSRTNAIYYQRTHYSTPTSWTAPEQVIDNNGWAHEFYNTPTISAQERGGTFYPVIAWTDWRGPTLDVYYTTPGATYTITSNPTSTGGLPAVQVDSVTYTTPASFNWVAGINHTIGAPSPQAGTGVRYLFASWSDLGNQYHQTAVYTMDAMITANFITQYLLTVSTDPSGLSPQPYTSPSGPWYDNGTVVNVTAQTVIGSYSLHHWTVDSSDVPGDSTVWIAMNETHNVIAHYELDTSPPSISNLQQNPPGQQIQPNQSVNIQVTATDSETGVNYVELLYRTSSDNATWSGWTVSFMDKIVRDTYNGTIPGFSIGTYVQYMITAFDNANNPATLPATLYFDYTIVPELQSPIMAILLLLSVSTLLILTKRKRSH